MDKEKFEDLQKSVEEMKAIEAGEIEPSRVFVTSVPNDTDGIERTASGKIKITLSDEELKHQKEEKLINNEAKKMKNLNYSGKQDPSIIRAEVKKRIALKELEVHKLFTDDDEKKLAKDLAKTYLTEFTPKSISDKNNLKSVIYLEVLQFRLQSVMNDLTAQGSSAIPLNLVDSIHKNLKEIAANKERLGLIGKEKEQKESDGFKILQNVKEKFKVWMENNQGSRSLVCPDCGKMVMLKIRMDKWIAQKHPFFKDRFLANKHLMKLYLQKKLTKEDIAEVLEASPDYIDWLIETLWMTDPEYRKEFRKYEGKYLRELERKLKEQTEKASEEDELQSGELVSGETEDEQIEEQTSEGKEESEERPEVEEVKETKDFIGLVPNNGLKAEDYIIKGEE